MEPDKRDEVVDFVRHWSVKAEMPITSLLTRMSLNKSRCHDWRQRYGKVNEHNGLIPRGHWRDIVRTGVWLERR